MALPANLTPSQACDLHLAQLDWAGTRDAEVVLKRFSDAFGRNQPYDWGEFTTGAYMAHTLKQKLGGADTFYVTAEMLLMASEAAVDLEGMPLFERDVVSDNMLIILDLNGGVGYDNYDKYDPEIRGNYAVRAIHVCRERGIIRVVQDGVAQPEPENLLDGVSVFTYFDVNQTTHHPNDEGRLISDFTPAPMFPGDFTAWAYGRRWERRDSSEQTLTIHRLSDHVADQRRLLLSILLLMAEERYTQRERPDRPAIRRWQRSGLKLPEDMCVSVTRLRRPHRRAPLDEGSAHRYSHQWLVRGHWRRLHKDTPAERAVWVEPYIKGPEGAPFIVKRKLTRLEV